MARVGLMFTLMIKFHESTQGSKRLAGTQHMMRLLTMVIVLVAGAGQALAQATVQANSARVFVNNVAISGSVTANPGATVSASDTGYAIIYYKNGCSEVVKALQTRMVQDDPVCDQAGYFDYDKTTGLVVGGLAIGGLLGIIYSHKDDDKPVSP